MVVLLFLWVLVRSELVMRGVVFLLLWWCGLVFDGILCDVFYDLLLGEEVCYDCGCYCY